MLKKCITWLILSISLFQSIFDGFIFAQTVSAASETLSIVVVLVDKKLADSDLLKKPLSDYYGNVARSTTSKVVLFPVDFAKTTGSDYHRILYQLYTEGFQGAPSVLQGVIFIGKPELPLVNDNGFIYPSVFPLTDFREPGFIYEPGSQYFIKNKDVGEPKAEVRHTIISFATEKQYESFFYRRNGYTAFGPGMYTPKAWYDDFVLGKQSFNTEGYPLYQLRQIFGEDLTYNRYSALIMDIINVITTSTNYKSIFDTLPKDNSVETTDDYPDSYKKSNSGLTKTLAGLLKIINPLHKALSFVGLIPAEKATQLVNQGVVQSEDIAKKYIKNSTLSTDTSAKGVMVPVIHKTSTIPVGQMIIKSLKSYSQLFAPSYFDDIKLIFDKGGRYSYFPLGSGKFINGSNSSLWKVDLNDQFAHGMLRGYNNYFEKLTEEYIGQQKPYMTYPVLINYRTYKKGQAQDIYENFYFGVPASRLKSIEDATIFRGTFYNTNNIEDLKKAIKKPLHRTDLVDSNAGIGQSTYMLDQETESHRGYNFNLLVDNGGSADDITTELLKSHDPNECNDEDNIQKLNEAFFRGFSPINIDRNKLKAGDIEIKRQDLNFDKLFAPSWNPILGIGAIDIGGSKITNIQKFNYRNKADFDAIRLKEQTQELKQKYGSVCESKFNGMLSECDRTGGAACGQWAGAMYQELCGGLNAEEYTRASSRDGKICTKEFNLGDYTTTGQWNVSKLEKHFLDDGFRSSWFSSKDKDQFEIVKRNAREEEIGNCLYEEWDKELINNPDQKDTSQELSEKASKTYEVLKNFSSVQRVLYSEFFKIPRLFRDEFEYGNDDLVSVRVCGGKDKGKRSIAPIDYFDFTNYRARNGIPSNEYRLELLPNIQTDGLNLTRKEYSQMFQDAPYGAGPIKRHQSFRFRTVDTRFYHTAPTYEQIQGKPLLFKDVKIRKLRPYMGGNAIFGGNKGMYVPLLSFWIGDQFFYLAPSMASPYANSIEHDGGVTEYTLGGNAPTISVQGKIINLANRKIVKNPFGSGFLLVKQEGDRFGGLNMMTPDRPIDSKRRVSFLGLGGDTIELVYPTLYDVPVYKDGKLMSPDAIEESIKNYLVGVAKTNNKFLGEQLGKAGANLQKNIVGYSFLAKVDPLAVPNRQYQLMPNDIYIKGLSVVIAQKTVDGIATNYPVIGEDAIAKNTNPIIARFYGEDSLKILARYLYHLNVDYGNKASLTNNPLDRLQDYLKGGNYSNNKRKQIIKDYLVEAPDKVKPGGPSKFKDWKSVSGSYLPQWDDGYEITYLNSDGADYITNSNTDSIRQELEAKQSRFATSQKPKAVNQTIKCSDKSYGTSVPLLDRPDAMSCWFSTMKAKKFASFDLKVAFSGLPSYMLTDEGKRGDVISSYFKGLWQEFGESSPQLALTKEYEGSGFDAAIEDTYGSTDRLKGGMPKESEVLNTFIQGQTDTQITFSTLSIPVDSASQLYVSTRSQSKWNASVFAMVNGDVCLQTNGQDLCKTRKKIYGGLIDGRPLKIGDFKPTKQNKQGGGWITLYICDPSNENNCSKSLYSFTVTAGKIARFVVTTPNQQGNLPVFRGTKLPGIIQAFDSQNNPISYSVLPFELLVDDGEIDDGGTVGTSALLQSIDMQPILFETNLSVKNQITASLVPYGSKQSLFTSKIAVEDGLITVQKDGERVSEISYKLPRSADIIFDPRDPDGVAIKKDNLPNITVALQSLKGAKLWGVGKVYSKKGLFSVGNIVSKGGLSFIGKINSIEINGTSTGLVIVPGFVAGSDELVVEVGSKKYSIPVKILPGDPYGITIKPDKEGYEIGEKPVLSLQAIDRWGNAVLNDVDGNVQIYGGYNGLIKDPSDSITQMGAFNLSADVALKQGKGKVLMNVGFAIGNNIVDGSLKLSYASKDQQRIGFAVVRSQGILRPTTGINSLHVTLDGNDWGNVGQFSTKTPYYIEKMLVESSKLLSVNTLLINPQKIKKSLLVVSSSGSLAYYDQGFAPQLGVNQSNLSINASGISVSLGKLTDYQMLIAGGFTGIDKLKSNTLVVVPEQSSNVSVSSVSIKDGNIMILNPVQGVANGYSIKPTDKFIGGNAIWGVYRSNQLIATLIVYRTDRFFSQLGVEEGFIFDGSKFELKRSAVGSFNGRMNAWSIQHTTETLEQNQKRLVDQFVGFSQGMTIGASSVQYYKPWHVHFGDPTVTKVSKNWAQKPKGSPFPIDMDNGLGQPIWTDHSKSIKKVLSIDYNGDKKLDLMYVQDDGSVHLIENIGGMQPWVYRGRIFLIAGGIQNIFAGDVDRDGDQDVVVLNYKNSMRVYYNLGGNQRGQNGSYDVDGNPICLNVAGGPQVMDKVYAFVLRDVDADGGLDIVTYDQIGDVKVFYGGSDALGRSNYVSTDKLQCDSGLKDLKNSRNVTSIVDTFGVGIKKGVSIPDESIIHWKGLTSLFADTQGKAADVPLGGGVEGISEGDFKNIENIKGIKEAGKALGSVNFDKMQSALTKHLGQYITVPGDFKPWYEDQKTQYSYSLINQLKPFVNPFSVDKYFEDVNGGSLVDGDKVEVRIKISGPNGLPFTYRESLQGPWEVSIDDQGGMKELNRGNLPDSVIITKYSSNTAPYLFGITNVTALSEPIEISYYVTYRQTKIGELQVGEGKYPHIKLIGNDSCKKLEWNYQVTDNNRRTYVQKSIGGVDLAVRQYLIEKDEYFDKQQKNIDSQLDQSELIEKAFKETWNNITPLERGFGVKNDSYAESLPIYENLKLGLGSAADEWLAKSVVDPLLNSCNGISLKKAGECQQNQQSSLFGLPFNMDLLSPGTMQLFNYPVCYFPGLPLFAFPTDGTVIPVWPPIPSGAGGVIDPTSGLPRLTQCLMGLGKAALVQGKTIAASNLTTDDDAVNQGVGVANMVGEKVIDAGFSSILEKSALSSNGLTSRSLVRLYVSPTISAGLGITICGGTYNTLSLPNPLNKIIGNCVVFTVDSLLPKKNICEYEQPTKTPTEVFYKNFNQCDKDLIGGLDKNKFQSPTVIINVEPSLRNDFVQQFEIDENTIKSQSQKQQEAASVESKIQALSNPRLSFNLNTNAAATDVGLGTKNTTSIFNYEATRELEDPDAPARAQIKYENQKSLKTYWQGFVARQVAYIKDNLLNRGIQVYLPDFSSIVQGNDDKVAINTELLKPSSEEKKTINKSAKKSPEQKLKEFDPLQNPYDKLLQFTEQTNVLHVQKSTVLVKVPRISKNDLNTLLLWAVGHKAKLSQSIEYYQEYYNTMKGKCDRGEQGFSAAYCAQQLAKLQGGIKAVRKNIENINANITTIQSYIVTIGALPQYQYVYEDSIRQVNNMVDQTFGQVNRWLDRNAQLFDAWVDVLTSFVHILKTRQVFVDVPAQRERQCGDCRVETLAQGNAKFSWGMIFDVLPELGPIPIPNFRVPNFVLDFSEFNLGMTVVVPDFKFVPFQVIDVNRLVQIQDPPTLPQLLPGVNFDLDIPTIGLLPTAPQLPAPPRVAITSKIELPDLPPAPRIPALMPEIRKFIQVIGALGKLYCIYKGNFGLVAEDQVKGKVETATMRTATVPRFDHAKIDLFGTKIQGYDLQLKTVANFSVYFNGLYSFTNSFAQQNNKMRDYLADKGYDAVDEKINDVNASIQDGFQKVDDGIVNLFEKQQSFTPYEMNNRLISELSAIRELHRDDGLIKRSDSLIQEIQQKRPEVVKTNIAQKATSEYQIWANKEISESRKSYELMKYDYDKWLRTLVSDEYVSDEGDLVVQGNLFDVDSATKNMLQTHDSLTKEMLTVQLPIMQGLRDSVQKSKLLSSNEKTVLLSRADVSIKTIEGMGIRQLAQTYGGGAAGGGGGSSNGGGTTTYGGGYDGGAAGGGNGGGGSSSSYPGSYLNYSQRANSSAGNIFKNVVRDTANYTTDMSDNTAENVRGFWHNYYGTYYNVVGNNDIGDRVTKANIYADINSDNTKDYVFWDDGTIYVKYGNQNNLMPGGVNPGVVAGGNKVRYGSSPVYDLKTQDQSYDSMSFTYSAQDVKVGKDIAAQVAQGYLVRLSTNISDTSNSKYQLYSSAPVDGSTVIIIDNKKITVQQAIDQKKLISVSTIVLGQESQSILINNVDRYWYYPSIQQLSFDQTSKIFTPISSWSVQDVGGQQITADSNGPTVEVKLVRIKTNEVVAEGFNLRGWVNTNYKIVITWKDQTSVTNAGLATNGKEYVTKSVVEIPNLYYKQGTVKTFDVAGVDQAGNQTVKKITLTIGVPKISIDSVNDLGNNKKSVATSWTEKMDEGTVSYQNKPKSNRPDLLSLAGQKLFRFGLDQTTLTGGIFLSPKSDAVLVDENGNGKGSVDSKGVTVGSGVQTKLDFAKGYPIVNITQSGKTIFEIYLASKSLLGADRLTVLNPSMKLVSLKNLPATQVGEYAGGRCVASIGNECELYLSDKGNIKVADGYQSLYGGTYLVDNQSSMYRITRNGVPVIQFRFVPEGVK